MIRGRLKTLARDQRFTKQSKRHFSRSGSIPARKKLWKGLLPKTANVSKKVYDLYSLYEKLSGQKDSRPAKKTTKPKPLSKLFRHGSAARKRLY